MLIPTLCRPETNRLSDTFPAKMGLFRISREWKVEVCICGEPSVSPQSARAGEHFYRWEEEVGRALTESMAFHCLRPCQERRAVLLLPVGAAVVVTSCIKLSEAFYWGPHGITQALCGGDDCCLSGGTSPVQSITDPLSIPGRCSLQVFSPLSRGQYLEVLAT